MSFSVWSIAPGRLLKEYYGSGMCFIKTGDLVTVRPRYALRFVPFSRWLFKPWAGRVVRGIDELDWMEGEIYITVQPLDGGKEVLVHPTRISRRLSPLEALGMQA